MFYKKFVKRILDLLLAIPMFVVLLIPLTVIGLVIKLTSKGPILFKQERYGRNSKPFLLYKFRSMTNKAPVKANSEFDDIASYVTPFGMIIRRTSLMPHATRLFIRNKHDEGYGYDSTCA